MKQFFNLDKLTLLHIAIITLVSSVILRSEGTRELAPNAQISIQGNLTNDIAALHIDNAIFNNFASYDNQSVNSRFHIHIQDPLSEGIYLGFSVGHINNTGQNPPQVNYEYRILDPAGNVVFGPIVVNVGSQNINSWDEAFNGPMQLNGAGGYDAMEVKAIDLTSQGWTTEGDYYIELRNLSGGALLIDYWDITVVDNSSGAAEEKKGRIWSYNWAFFAINDFDFPNRPFNGSFYVCAPDPQNPDAAFVTEIDFNESGFRPAAFNIAFNSFGTLNTGVIASDRRSRENVNSTTPEYAIFLNDPIDICETAEPGEIDVIGLSRCSASDFCIKFVSTKAGQIDLLLDFDGPDNVFTPGTADVMITGSVSAANVDLATCIQWDGLDGFGNSLAEDIGTAIPISLSFAQGIYHFPIYDAELMTTGFKINTVRPSGNQPLLYYDDTNITADSGTGEPKIQLMGCNLPCHGWTNYTTGNTIGFGNLNTINSWWFSQQSMNTEIFFLPGMYTCNIEGPQVACEGESVSLAVIVDFLPQDATALQFEGLVWEGPGILGTNDSEIVEVDAAGIYNVNLDWITALGDTCTSTCEFNFSTLPTPTFTIDTLLEYQDTIMVNNETYFEEGVFTQILTSSVGCDSILTIIIDINIPEVDLICAIEGPEYICEGSSTILILELIKDPTIAPNPEVISITWSGPGAAIGANGSSVNVNQGGEYIAEYTWVNFFNDTLVEQCSFILEERPISETTIDTLINLGEVVEINGELYSTDGTFIQQLTAVNGCDSLLIITVDVIDPDYTCLVFGNPEICNGDISTLSIESFVEPAGAIPPQITGISWAGPGISGSVVSDTFNAEFNGLYTATIAWLNNDGIEESSTCTYELSVLPSFETQIDTLIMQGDTVVINGEIYTDGGQYFQGFTAQNGCDSLLVINVLLENSIVYFDLEDCKSSDYENFIPEVSTQMTCAEFFASNVYRENEEVNRHSCTPGVNGGVGMCISSVNSCAYQPGHEMSTIFEVVVNPLDGKAIQLTALRFFERAPQTFQWVVGTTGPNNYPTRYGVRVLKNGQEIFRSVGNSTSFDWSSEVFNFRDLPEFKVQVPSHFRFELLGYCLIGNQAEVAAWDLDDINLLADCTVFESNVAEVKGTIKSANFEALANVDLELQYGKYDHEKINSTSNDLGEFAFNDVTKSSDYTLRPISGDDYINGVSTMDLIHIQRHILGLERFESPYQMIAADANNSKSITAVDILQLRKLILGVYNELPENNSWRYADSNKELHVSNPWNIDEEIYIHNLSNNINKNFVGIKIGDVNNDFKSITSNSSAIEGREEDSKNLRIQDKFLDRNTNHSIDIRLDEIADVYGLQFALEFSGIEIVNISSSLEEISEYFVVKENKVFFSISSDDFLELEENAVMTLEVSALTEGMISEMLYISSDLEPEIYTTNEILKSKLNLTFDEQNINTDPSLEISNYPNPFNANTRLRIVSESASKGEVVFYNSSGIMIKSLKLNLRQGINSIELLKSDFNGFSGLIIYEFKTDNQLISGRMMLID